MSELRGPEPDNDPSGDSWRPPAAYQWQPEPAQYTPLPARIPPGQSSGTTVRNRQGGLLGGLLAAGAAFLKYGVVLLKIGKLGPTLISMVIAVFFYTIFFGPAFAIGLVLLILIHETGHVLVSKWQGVPMTLPVFLGPFGAVTGMKAPPRDAQQEAVIAIGGPVFGTAAAFLCFAWALAVPDTQRFHFFLLGLAEIGFFINLFNLIPMSPLDGGRVATAISRWMNVVGIAIMAVVAVLFSNPFAFIILIIGVISTVQRFRNAKRGLEPASVPPATRLVIGVAWLTMLTICVIGLSITHSAQVNSNTVPGVTQSSNSA
jgi:Zn-dependent protease